MAVETRDEEAMNAESERAMIVMLLAIALMKMDHGAMSYLWAACALVWAIKWGARFRNECRAPTPSGGRRQ